MKILQALFFLDIINAPIFMCVFTKHVLSIGGSTFLIGIIGTTVAILGLITKSVGNMLNLGIIGTVVVKQAFSLGITNIEFGAMGSVGALLGFISVSVAGHLSDTRGTSKVLPWCLFISAVGNLITAFSSSLSVLFLGRIVCAFGSPVQPLLNTLLTMLDKRARSEFLNKMGIFNGLAVIIGAMIGGYVSELENGVTYSYMLISFSSLLSIALVNQLPTSTLKKQTLERKQTTTLDELKSTTSNLKRVLASEKYWDIFTIKACMEIINGMIYTNFMFMSSVVFNLNGKHIGYLISALCVCGILSNVIQMKTNHLIYPNDKGFRRVMHGAVLLALTHMGITLTTTFGLFVCFLFTGSIARTLLEPALMELLLLRVSEKEKGTIMSSFDGIRSLTELFNPMVIGVITEVFGPKGVYPFCAVLDVGVGFISFNRRNKV